MIATGVFVEDIDAMHGAMINKIMLWLGAIAVVLLLTVFLVTRSIVGPVGRLRASLDSLILGLHFQLLVGQWGGW